MSRLEILQNSLAKKKAEQYELIQNHFETVKLANGQPLNDKRNGRAALNLWKKQNQAIRNKEESIAKTERAIEREKLKISKVANTELPIYIQQAIADGFITQWRKYPRFFFVAGVDKARIVLNEKTGFITHKYLNQISDSVQFELFKTVFNKLNAEAKKVLKHERNANR